MNNCEVFGQYDGGRVLFHTRVVSEQQLVQSTYHKFFPLVASTELVAIISAISLKYQRRQGKVEKVDHAREKEKIGGTAGNESCTCMISETS